MTDLPITGWRNAEGWCISVRGYEDFGRFNDPPAYTIPMCDLAVAEARIKELEAQLGAAK